MSESKEITVAKPLSTSERMMQIIERVASDPNADAGKAKAFLDMQLSIMNTQAHIDFQEAIARIKTKLKDIKIVKTRQVAYDIDKNDKSKGQKEAFKYAALEDIDKIVAPLLAEEGITDSYVMEPIANGWYNVKCRLSKGLYTEEFPVPLPLDSSGGKNGTQGAGSTFMYGRRYSLCAALGVVIQGMDDDGTGGPIDDAQALHIKNLIKESGADTAGFLKYMKTDCVENILFKDYRKATSALEEKIAKSKAEAAKKEKKNAS